jgi:hypothetical protein
MLLGFGFIDCETIPNVLFREIKDNYTFGVARIGLHESFIISSKISKFDKMTTFMIC